MNSTELGTAGCEYAYPAGIITDDEGYAAFFFCAMDWDAHLFDIRMQRLDAAGIPIGEEITAAAGQHTWFLPFGAAWTGSQYGLLFQDFVENSNNAGLLITLVDGTGGVAVEPFEIGKFRREENLAAIAWSGSEFGVAFSEDLFEQFPEDYSDYRTTIKIIRLSPGGDLIGEPVVIIPGLSSSVATRIVWTGSRYGVSWMEPYPRDSFAEISAYFAQVGCMPQE